MPQITWRCEYRHDGQWHRPHGTAFSVEDAKTMMAFVIPADAEEYTQWVYDQAGNVLAMVDCCDWDQYARA